jgi:hypothetical protein
LAPAAASRPAAWCFPTKRPGLEAGFPLNLVPQTSQKSSLAE